MEGNKKSRKSSGSNSVVVGIVAFILGFLFAFIVLIGSIFGVGYVAATTDINEVFRVLGLENENQNATGEDDKYNYINADKAPNILALVQEVMAMANGGLGEISLDKIDNLAPITDTVLDIAYEYIDEVVDFDKETFRKVSLTSVLDTVTTSVYYIRTAKVVDLLNEKMGYKINLDDIPVVPNLIQGVEAQYATVEGTDLKLPVLFDYFVNDGGDNYNRIKAVNSISAYPTGLDSNYITETMGKDEDGNKLYRVYYVPCKVSGTSITEAEYKLKPLTVTNEAVSYTDENGQTKYLKYTFRTIEYGSDTKFIAVKPQVVDGKETFVIDPANIDMYDDNYAINYHDGIEKRKENDAMYGVKTINGINYFKDNAGNVIDYDPLTISDIMLNPGETLENLYVSDLIGQFAGEGNADIISEVLAGISLGDMINQSVNYDEVIENIKISTLLNEVKADDTVMTYIVYNISNVENNGGVYTATYDKGGENEKIVTLTVDANGVIKSMKDSANNAVYGNTVKDLNTITNGLTLDIFLDVKADDAIMSYIGYGISNVVAVTGQSWQYEGTIGEGTNAKTVHIYTDDNGYVTKVTDTSGNTVKGTTIDEVSDRVNGIMDVIAIPDLIDINPEEPIMAYLGYGLYDVVAGNGVDGSGKAYTHVAKYKDNGTEITVYISSESNVIKSVWKEDGTKLKGTKANEVSSLVGNVDQALRISDFVDIEADNAIMVYVGYGVYNVEVSAGTNNGKAYTHTGKIEVAGVDTAVCIATDANKVITSIWEADSGKTVDGTKVGNISDRFDNLYNKLKIKDLLTVTEGSSAILKALQDSTVNGLDSAINNLQIGEIITIDPNTSPKILQALANTKINGLSDKIDSLTVGDVMDIGENPTWILNTLKDTKINELQGKIDNLTVGDFIEITDSSSQLLKTIKDKNITELESTINNLEIGDIITTDENSSKILTTLIEKHASINNLDEVIKGLTVSDVLSQDEINQNAILSELRDKNIFALSTEIDKVLIQRIYAEQIYGTGATLKNNTGISYSSKYLYYTRSGNERDGYTYTITDVNCGGLTDVAYDNALGKITEAQFNTGDYYTYGEAQGMWKLILYRVQSDGTKTEKAYTLNNFDYMVNSCSDVVYNSTLNELKDAEIIGNEIDQAALDKKLKTVVVEGGIPTIKYIKVVDGNISYTANESEATPIGSLTLKQLLVAITSSI